MMVRPLRLCNGRKKVTIASGEMYPACGIP